jgi:hypothetical protein
VRVRALLTVAASAHVRKCFCAVHDGTLPFAVQSPQCPGFVYSTSLEPAILPRISLDIEHFLYLCCASYKIR